MRAETLHSFVVAMALALVAWFVPANAFAQDGPATQPGHEEGGRLLLTQLPTEVRQRAHSLWSKIVCACPRENWSKSLANCPDGCADEQKARIVRRVTEGWDDQRILDEQLKIHGPQVLGMPSGAATYVLPFVVLVIAGVLAVLTLLHIRRKKSDGTAPAIGASDAEVDAVLRELEEVR